MWTTVSERTGKGNTAGINGFGRPRPQESERRETASSNLTGRTISGTYVKPEKRTFAKHYYVYYAGRVARGGNAAVVLTKSKSPYSRCLFANANIYRVPNDSDVIKPITVVEMFRNGTKSSKRPPAGRSLSNIGTKNVAPFESGEKANRRRLQLIRKNNDRGSRRT